MKTNKTTTTARSPKNGKNAKTAAADQNTTDQNATGETYLEKQQAHVEGMIAKGELAGDRVVDVAKAEKMAHLMNDRKNKSAERKAINEKNKAAREAKKGETAKAKGTGVVAEIVKMLKIEGGSTKAEILAHLIATFPERSASGMETTVGCQVNHHLKARGIPVLKTAEKRYYIEQAIPADAEKVAEQPENGEGTEETAGNATGDDTGE